MSSVIVDARANSLLALAPGLAITAIVALIAYLGSHYVGFLKNYQMITAIIFGALVRNVIGLPTAAREGLSFTLRRILRFSIVLLGLQITVQQMIEIGSTGVIIIAIAL